jgi:hypothetical protein
VKVKLTVACSFSVNEKVVPIGMGGLLLTAPDPAGRSPSARRDIRSV